MRSDEESARHRAAVEERVTGTERGVYRSSSAWPKGRIDCRGKRRMTSPPEPGELARIPSWISGSLPGYEEERHEEISYRA